MKAIDERFYYEEDEQYVRAKKRFLQIGIGLGCGVAVVAALSQYLDGQIVTVLISLIFPVFAPFINYYMQRDRVAFRRSLKLFAWLVLLSQAASALFTLDVLNSLFWYPVFPMVYFFLLGYPTALRWTVTAYLLTIVCYVLFPFVNGHEAVALKYFLLAMAAYALMTALAWFYILSLHRYQMNLYKRANYDFLTNLVSRAAGMSLLTKLALLAERENGHEFSVILLDLDNFKFINDNYGHDQGDEVLRDVAKQLNKRVRGSDSVIRWGGEEFLVILPVTIAENAQYMAEEIRLSFIEELDTIPDLNIGASFGIAQYIPGEGVDKFLKRADLAMYHAKRAGKNNVQVAEVLQV